MFYIKCFTAKDALLLIFIQISCWTPGGSRNSPVKQSVFLSVRLSLRYLGIGSLVFSKFWHGDRNPYEVVRNWVRFFEKNFLHQKLAKWAKMGFSRFLKILFINFYSIWSVMKFYIICFIPTQIQYFGKILFLRYGSKCSWGTRMQDF